MAANKPYKLDAVNNRGVGVRVAFERVSDRFSQTLYGLRKDAVDAVAHSVDDKDFEGWPLSFPVQELREVENAAAQRALLLMGSAAYGHWSATVQVTHFDDANPYIEFDVAVRLHRAPAYLGIAYKTIEGATWTGTPGGLAFAHRPPHSIVIAAPLKWTEGDVYAPTDFVKAFESPHDANAWLFLPASPLPSTYPATYRWKYCVASALA
ncbi:MAG TPA: hypothetical protein VF175_19520 [Lacipirellula sp.]